MTTYHKGEREGKEANDLWTEYRQILQISVTDDDVYDYQDNSRTDKDKKDSITAQQNEEDKALGVGGATVNILKRVNSNEEQSCPKVNIKVGRKVYEALLDTGSMISIVTRKMYEDFKKEIDRIEVLPTRKLKITGAFGTKHVEAKMQIYLPFTIEQIDASLIHDFKVVEQINVPIILGSDWLSRNHGIIDYENNEFAIKIEGKKYVTTLLKQMENATKSFCINWADEQEHMTICDSEADTEWEDMQDMTQSKKNRIGEGMKHEGRKRSTPWQRKHRVKMKRSQGTMLRMACINDDHFLLQENMQPNENIMYPMLTATIGERIVSVVTDTGSALNAIEEDLYLINKREKKIIEERKGDIDTTSIIPGQKAEIQREVKIAIEMKGEQISDWYVVVKDLKTDILIGSETMKRLGMKINYEDRMIDWKGCRATREADHEDEQYVNSYNIKCDQVDTTETRREASDDVIEKKIREKVTNLEDVPESRLVELEDLLVKHQRVFREEIGVIENYQYKFKVKSKETFFKRPYVVPFALKEKVDKEIQRMLRYKIIERSNSQYNNPVVPVIKRNGEIRLVLDARQLNNIIESENDRPLSMDELLSRFHNLKVLTGLDLVSAFWQISLSRECRPYTAFLVNGKCYQFCRLPFGLKISTAAFVRAMDYVLGEELIHRIIVYIDDIIIGGKDWKEYFDLLDEVLDKFERAGMTINLEKSQFCKCEMKFLGHTITNEGIKPDPENVKAIKEFPTPKTRKQLKSFLGMVGFLRKHATAEALTAPNLHDLLKKYKGWKWTEACEREFQIIKQSLIEAPILKHPDMSLDFCLSVDASGLGIGAELYQIDKDGNHCTIAYASRVLSAAERSYSVTEQECLAWLWAYKRFYIYLAGRKTHIYTDHRALEFLMKSKLMPGRLSRWALYLQQFEFEIHHIPGKDNVVADCLSRSPINDEPHEKSLRERDEFTVMLVDSAPFENYLKNEFPEIKKHQEKDQTLSNIKNKLKNPQNVKLRQMYKSINGVLHYKNVKDDQSWNVCVPEELVNKTIWYMHYKFGHCGPTKCQRKLLECCHFPQMAKRVRKVLRVCKKCQEMKPPTTAQQSKRYAIVPKRVNEIIATDLYGPIIMSRRRNRYVLVVMDLFSKYVCVRPLKVASGKTVSEMFKKHILPKYKNTKFVLSDNGPQYRSQKWKTMLRKSRLKPIYISKYRPQCNPTERVMRELGRHLRTYAYKKHKDWDEYLASFEDVMNNLPHDSTGYAPVQVQYGKTPKNPLKDVITVPGRTARINKRRISQQALENIEYNAERRNRTHNKEHKERGFTEGDLVLVKNRKLASRSDDGCKKFYKLYIGPYEVKRVKHPNAYELRSVKTNKDLGLRHIADLKPFYQ